MAVVGAGVVAWLATVWGSLAQIAPDVFQIKGAHLMPWFLSPSITWLLLPFVVGLLLFYLWRLDRKVEDLRKGFDSAMHRIENTVKQDMRQQQRRIDRDFSKRIVDLERKAGLRPPEKKTFKTHDGHEFNWEFLAALPEAQLAEALTKYQGLSEWYDRETSDRMGPPGRPGAPWPEDMDDSAWRYREVDGREWKFRDVCSLPIPERTKLKQQKPDVWRAYWEEVSRRDIYVAPDGKRWTHADLDGKRELELIAITTQVDPDIVEWAIHGRSF